MITGVLDTETWITNLDLLAGAPQERQRPPAAAAVAEGEPTRHSAEVTPMLVLSDCGGNECPADVTPISDCVDLSLTSLVKLAILQTIGVFYRGRVYSRVNWQATIGRRSF